jgi:hypothetical protein
MSNQPSKFRDWIREPLVQFMAIGLGLYLIFAWRGDTGPNSYDIVVTQGQVDALAAGFVGVWQRPPNEQELKALVDDFVREEIATREAMRMGLDRDDVVIRRRLRQKVEFLTEDISNASPPTDSELQAYFNQYPDKFRTEPEVAIRQVFLNPNRRHAETAHDAKLLLARLSATGADTNIKTLGDPLMRPSEMPLSSRTEVSRLFGNGFADEVLKLTPGRWSGPIESAYGLHLVFATERVDGRLPSLAQIRPLVEREMLSDRQTHELDAMYDQLLKHYHVIMERHASRSATSAQAGSTPAAKSIAAPKDID